MLYQELSQDSFIQRPGPSFASVLRPVITSQIPFPLLPVPQKRLFITAISRKVRPVRQIRLQLLHHTANPSAFPRGRAGRARPREGVSRHGARALRALRRIALRAAGLPGGILLLPGDHGVDLLARPDQARVVLLLEPVADLVQRHQRARPVDVVPRGVVLSPRGPGHGVLVRVGPGKGRREDAPAELVEPVGRRRGRCSRWLGAVGLALCLRWERGVRG